MCKDKQLAKVLKITYCMECPFIKNERMENRFICIKQIYYVPLVIRAMNRIHTRCPLQDEKVSILNKLCNLWSTIKGRLKL